MPVFVLIAAGCGVPGDTEPRAVDASSVPYRLLDTEPSASAAQTPGPVPVGTPLVFWLRGDDSLAPSPAIASCADQPAVVVQRLLLLLEVGPDEVARSAGRSSAIPPDSEPRLVEVSDEVALMELDPATSIAADRLPLAVGQLVLSVTSAPGIEAVRVSIEGEAVQLPLPGGALTSDPVSADDYASLLPGRFLDPDERGRLSPDVGCPASASSG